jgi:hypothetical protein
MNVDAHEEQCGAQLRQFKTQGGVLHHIVYELCQKVRDRTCSTKNPVMSIRTRHRTLANHGNGAACH